MIFVILLVGFVLRVISLNQSLWLDEATSALVARMSLTDIFTKFLPADFHPPLYYIVLKYWVNVFGSSEISLRIPSTIFGILTIYFVFLITKKLFDSKTGYLASLLLATSGLAVYYSQEARMYSMAAFLVSLLVYFYISKKWVGFTTILVLVAMTDYVSLFVIPIFWFASHKDWKKLAVAHVPMAIAFTLFLPIFLKQISAGFAQKGTAWWNILGTSSVKNVLLIPIKFIFGRISFENKIMYFIIAFAAALIFGIALFFAKKASKIIWYWLSIPIILGVLMGFKIPTLSYFRFLFCLPAFYILVARGIEKSNKYKNFLLISVFIINILSTGYYLFNKKFQREDWRLAAKTIGGSEIILPGNSQKEALVYYGKGNQIETVYDISPSQRDLWLSRYVWEIVDPADSTRKKIENLGYNKTAEYDFNGVVFFRYSKTLYASRY